MSDVRAAIEDLIRKHTGCTAVPPPDADLLDAINIDGDDVSDLMQDFAARFHVDLSGYRWFYHHGPEGFFLIPPRFWGAAYDARRIPITIALLEQAATLGKWPLTYPDLPEEDQVYGKHARCINAKFYLALFVFFCVIGWKVCVR